MLWKPRGTGIRQLSGTQTLEFASNELNSTKGLNAASKYQLKVHVELSLIFKDRISLWKSKRDMFVFEMIHVKTGRATTVSLQSVG
jgi:hypothetical protein